MTQGLVLYTDGGCRPNPGPGGWGMHGYLYLAEKPKKGSGNPDHVLTTQGYKTKVEVNLGKTPHEEVTPIHYVDGLGTFSQHITNNVAELTAAISALRHALDFDVTVVQIITDSEYVIKGMEGWVDTWAKNNWLKKDGAEVINAKQWRELVALRERLEQRNVDVRFDWIKGHDDLLGNINADHLATVAVLTSRRLGETNTHIVTTKAEGYWGYTPDRHPFLANRRMYFNTRAEFNRSGEYYLGEHGKDDDMLGKRVADGAFAVVSLAEPDAILEMVRNYQTELAQGMDSIVMMCLDKLYRPETHKELSMFGTRALIQPNAYRLDLLCLDDQPATRELRPPKIAMRAVDAVSDLAEKMGRYLAKHPSIVVTDLTPILYEKTVKVSKKADTPATETFKLKPEYNVGFAALEVVDAAYRSGEEDVATCPVTLTLGIDMLDRNALKRLEAHNPKVSLITWLEAPDVFRYATVIETATDQGIWAGVYSNLRVVSP